MFRRVLAIDENPSHLEILEEALGGSYHVTTSTDATTALTVAQAAKPDLVLIDVGRRGSPGLDVCRRLSTDPSYGRPKIILLSAAALSSERAAGYEAGADDYTIKPFDQVELLAKVRLLLRVRALEQTYRDHRDTIREMSAPGGSVAVASALASRLGPDPLVGRLLRQLGACASELDGLLVHGELSSADAGGAVDLSDLLSHALARLERLRPDLIVSASGPTATLRCHAEHGRAALAFLLGAICPESGRVAVRRFSAAELVGFTLCSSGDGARPRPQLPRLGATRRQLVLQVATSLGATIELARSDCQVTFPRYRRAADERAGEGRTSARTSGAARGPGPQGRSSSLTSAAPR